MEHSITIKIPVILFKEDGVTIAYSPSVNIYGYGETESAAKKSFEVSVEEFFRYTLNKNTLKSELEALGWKVKGDARKCTPPDISVSLAKNAEFRKIFDSQSFKKINRGISLPLFA